MNSAPQLLDALWRDYAASTPQAAAILRLLGERGETIVNDHVALRSLGAFAGHLGIGISALQRCFEAAGWQARDQYVFADKHLVARYWQHHDPTKPKVFISELEVGKLSVGAQAIIADLLAQVPAGFSLRDDLPWAGRPWRVSHAQYTALLTESEYAAWIAAFGFRVNHFTVDVNHLQTFKGLAELNAFLLEQGFVLNVAGGLIKGNASDCLEQSSTMAAAVDVQFSDGVFAIPSCYYEFAKRYRLPTGELFQGFVPGSANKLFESTNVR
jgi:hypothetical protein